MDRRARRRARAVHRHRRPGARRAARARDGEGVRRRLRRRDDQRSARQHRPEPVVEAGRERPRCSRRPRRRALARRHERGDAENDTITGVAGGVAVAVAVLVGVGVAGVGGVFVGVLVGVTVGVADQGLAGRRDSARRVAPVPAPHGGKSSPGGRKRISARAHRHGNRSARHRRVLRANSGCAAHGGAPERYAHSCPDLRGKRHRQRTGRARHAFPRRLRQRAHSWPSTADRWCPR